MPTGINSLIQWALPSNWDAARLMQVALQSGETYDGLISDIAAGLAIANAMLTSDPLIGGLISLTDEQQIEYKVGVSTGFEDHTELGRPDPKRGATTGHMLPLWAKDRAFAWTWDFLRKARRFQIDNDISSGFIDLRNVWRQSVLNRHFDSDAETVGTSGKSVPYADGGTADSTYVPPNMPDRASAFASSHDHFLRLNGISQANVETAVLHLWEHGHDAPYDLLVAEADIASWTDVTSVTGYVPRADPLVRYGNQTDLAGVADDYIGVVETEHGSCRLRSNARIPTKYWSVYKSYGNMDQRNPLKVFPSPQYGLMCVLLAGDHIREYPLENAMLFFEYGCGIGEDRTAAACVYNHTSGDYVDPTIL